MGWEEWAQSRQPSLHPGDADGDRPSKVQRQPGRHNEPEAPVEIDVHPVSGVGPRCSAAPKADSSKSSDVVLGG